VTPGTVTVAAPASSGFCIRHCCIANPFRCAHSCVCRASPPRCKQHCRAVPLPSGRDTERPRPQSAPRVFDHRFGARAHSAFAALPKTSSWCCIRRKRCVARDLMPPRPAMLLVCAFKTLMTEITRWLDAFDAVSHADHVVARVFSGTDLHEHVYLPRIFGTEPFAFVQSNTMKTCTLPPHIVPKTLARKLKLSPGEVWQRSALHLLAFFTILQGFPTRLVSF
jgi:hypothetical protein